MCERSWHFLLNYRGLSEKALWSWQLSNEVQKIDVTRLFKDGRKNPTYLKILCGAGLKIDGVFHKVEKQKLIQLIDEIDIKDEATL